MIECPFCGAEVIPGADVCEACEHSLADVGSDEPATRMERSLLQDRIAILEPKAPVAVRPETPIGDVLRQMSGASVGCVMVVDEQDTLLGIFSERDVLMRINVDAAAMAQRPIASVMTARPETLRLKDKIAYALHRMDVGGYRHIPILDDADRLVGVISIRDILAYLTARGAAVA